MQLLKYHHTLRLHFHWFGQNSHIPEFELCFSLLYGVEMQVLETTENSTDKLQLSIILGEFVIFGMELNLTC